MATQMTSVERARKIRRKDELVRKWTAEAERFTATDPVNRAMRRYCLGMARSAQDAKDKLTEGAAPVK